MHIPASLPRIILNFRLWFARLWKAWFLSFHLMVHSFWLDKKKTSVTFNLFQKILFHFGQCLRVPRQTQVVDTRNEPCAREELWQGTCFPSRLAHTINFFLTKFELISTKLYICTILNKYVFFSQIIQLLFFRNILSYGNGYNCFKSLKIGFSTSAVPLPLTQLNA